MNQPVEIPRPAEPSAELGPVPAPASAPAPSRGPSPDPDHARHPIHILYPSPFEALRSLLSILVVALFILTFIIQPFRIPSESMERTLLVGDFLLVNKSIYGPPGHFGWLLPYRPVRRGDVAVFYFPLNPAEHVVKRVIGIPGDRIHLQNGVVYRNGQPVSEPYTVNEPAYPDSFRDNFPAGTYNSPDIDTHWWVAMHKDEAGGDIVVPPGHYFVLGDNRNHSRDSRYWGFVPLADIVGRPFIIYFSLREPSTTDHPSMPQAAALPPRSDKLDHEGAVDKVVDHIVDFARWNRILRIVR